MHRAIFLLAATTLRTSQHSGRQNLLYKFCAWMEQASILEIIPIFIGGLAIIALLSYMLNKFDN